MPRTHLRILATDRDPETDGIEEAKPLDLEVDGWREGEGRVKVR